MANKTQPDSDRDYRPESVKRQDEGDFYGIVENSIEPKEEWEMQYRAERAAQKEAKKAKRAENKAARKDGTYYNKAKELARDGINNLPRKAVTRLAGASRKKKAVYGGAVGTLIGFVTFLLPILSGPLQFLSVADILTKALAPLNLATEGRNGSVLRTLNYLSDNPERGRLGIIGNRVADNVERRLNADGISINKSAAGFPTSITVEGVNVDLSDYDTNFSKRRALRGVLRDNGYGRVATAIMSRPINYRYGIDFKPLGNVRRAAFDSFAEFAQAKRQEVTDKVSRGSSNLDGVESSERDAEVQELEADRQRNQDALDAELAKDAPDQSVVDSLEAEIRRLDAEISSRNGALPGYEDVKQAYDTTDGNHTTKMEASRRSLINKLAGSGGPLLSVIALGVCFTTQIGEAAMVLEFANIYVPAWRLAQDAVSIASQIKSAEGVDIEELEVLSERLDNLIDNSSWSSAKTINYQETGVSEGVPAPLSAVPGTVQEDNFVQAGNFFGNIGIGDFNVSNICGFLGNPIVEAASWVLELGVAFFTGGTSLIASLGGIAGEELLARFLISPLGESILSRIVGEEINGMMAGADYGNAVGSGGLIAANEAGRSQTAFSLSGVAAYELNQRVAEREKDLLQQQSFSERYLALDNPGSMLSEAVLGSTTSSPIQKVAGLLNPSNSIQSSVAQLTGSFDTNVYAQTDIDPDIPLVYNYVPQIAYSVQELDNEQIVDPFENERYLLETRGYGTIENLDSTFEDCMDPLPELQTNIEDINIDEDYFIAVPQCASQLEDPTFANDFYRYRMYKFDIQNLLSIGCYGGDGAACGEIGLAYTFEGNEPQEEIVAAIYSDTATQSIIAKTKLKNETCAVNPNDPMCFPEPSFAAVFYGNLIRLFGKITKPEFMT